MDFNSNDFAKRIFDDMLGRNEPKAEKKVNAEEVAKPLFELFSGFVEAGFNEDQAMELVKFIIVSAFKMQK